MLTANKIDGTRVSEELLESIRRRVRDENLSPTLHVIFVGDNEASESYIKMKEKKAAGVGIDSTVHDFSGDATRSEIVERMQTLNDDASVDGIIVQLPLPDHLDELELLEAVDPTKDVDGLHPVNFGKLLGGGEPHFYPPTPDGIMRLLDEYDVPVTGQVVALVGMGRLVGRPLSQMLQNEDATVLALNEETPDLAQFTRQGDIVVAGAGVPKLIGEDHVESGTVVIDAGIHRVDGELVGDVDFDAVVDQARLITPVPGGVGPLTVAGLLKNTCESARRSE